MSRLVTLLLVVVLLGCQTPYQPQITTPPVVAANQELPIRDYIVDIGNALQRASVLAEEASLATSIDEVKTKTDTLFTEIWGISSGLTHQHGGANTHGWKTRWQAQFTEFDPAYGERYGDLPIEITDASELGIVGRGRLTRRVIAAGDPVSLSEPLGKLLIGLNNVIGWMRLDDGVTKAERQPRIDLTYLWDIDKSFWQSDADTGWIFVAQAQALNILKSNYSDLEVAKQHASDLANIIDRCLVGLDADGDGRIEPIPAEAGFNLALEQLANGEILR